RAERGSHDHFKLPSIIGSVRTRMPVAAKIALHTAGAAAGRPGSPRPVGGASDLMKCTSANGGDWVIRIMGYWPKFVSAAAPRLIVIFWNHAALMPSSIAPCTWLSAELRLMIVPASTTAVSF